MLVNRVFVINHMAKGSGAVMWCVTLVPVPDDACRDSSVATRSTTRAREYPPLHDSWSLQNKKYPRILTKKHALQQIESGRYYLYALLLLLLVNLFSVINIGLYFVFHTCANFVYILHNQAFIL